VRLRGALALSLSPFLGLACSAEKAATPSAPSASAAAAVATWSRQAFSPASAGTHAADPRTVIPSDPAALDELVAAAPRNAPRPAGKDGGAALGHDTGLPIETAAPVVSAAPQLPGKPRIVVGTPTVQPAMANAAIERAARAQLYWNLVQRCRDPEGRILPPEAIHLHFRIDGDGAIVPSTIVATPASARFTDAAYCMQRELSTASFQAPVGARGRESTITATVPSVD
jgi:hypothetical protein